MIDAQEGEKELDYLNKFVFKQRPVLTYQPPRIEIQLTPGMDYDQLVEEVKQQSLMAACECISSMLRQCDEEIRRQRQRGAFHNIHSPEPKTMVCWCGEVEYCRRAYYDREDNHRYLCDEVLGLAKGQGVSINMLLRALKLAGQGSYEKVKAQIVEWTGITRSAETYRRWVLRIGEFIMEQEKKKRKALFANPSYRPDDYGKEPTFLFLEADGCHIFMRLSEELIEQLKAEVQEGKRKAFKRSKKKEVRLGLWYEGKAPRRGTEGNGQYEVTGKTYFGGLVDVDAFWETAALTGLERYGLGPLTYVLGSGDGGKWIGPRFEDFRLSTFSLCRFHWKRDICRAFAHDKKNGIEKSQQLIDYVVANDKEQTRSFLERELDACEKESARKKLKELKKYLFNQWDFIQNYGRLNLDYSRKKIGIEGSSGQVIEGERQYSFLFTMYSSNPLIP